MLKNSLLFILSFFLPLIIVFTLYRATLDKGAISLKYVFDVVSNEFITTSNGFSNLVNDLSSNFTDLVESITNFWNPDYNPLQVEDSVWGFIANFFVKMFWIPIQMVQLAFNVFIDLIGLVVVFISDFVSLIKVLGYFVFGVSPYSVNPYFPVP